MTSYELMTRDELLENAALDAFGLLDEYEAALYTRSFHHAHVTVQDELLRLQAELVCDESLLSSENPDPAMRQQVLDAVARKIESESSQLAPLAIIGRPRTEIEQEHDRPVIAGRISGAGAYWRAACFALCAALIVVAYNLTEANSANSQISAYALNDLTDRQLETLIGPTVKDFMFDSSAKRIVLKASDSANDYRGVLYVREGHNDAFLVVEGLPLGTDFRVCVKDARGGIETTHRFSSKGHVHGARFELKTLALNNVNWLITDSAGIAVLASI